MVLVTGCLPQAEQAGFFARFPFVDGALGPQNLHRLPELLRGRRGAGGRRAPPATSTTARTSAATSRRAASARSRRGCRSCAGCTNFCSYCIVPHVRGPERSRALGELVAEVRGARRRRRARGHPARPERQRLRPRPLRATGEAGAPDFADAPARPRRRPGPRARPLHDLAPQGPLATTSSPAVAELPSVCEHVHLPAQAGSDRVLAAMRRGYTAARYLERVAALRAAVPDVSITTDLIAGFPGETEDDFAQTLDARAGGGLRRGLHLRLLAASAARPRPSCRTRCRRTSSASASSASSR